MAGAVTHSKTDSAAWRQILRAALQQFVEGGDAATSARQIVGTAKVSKPALHHCLQDKAALFQGLVDEAHGECYRLNPSAFRRMGLTGA